MVDLMQKPLVIMIYTDIYNFLELLESQDISIPKTKG